MARKIKGILTVQTMVGTVKEGEIVGSPIGPRTVVGEAELAIDPAAREISITKCDTGKSITMGYTPAYAEGFERLFKPSKVRTKFKPCKARGKKTRRK